MEYYYLLFSIGHYFNRSTASQARLVLYLTHDISYHFLLIWPKQVENNIWHSLGVTTKRLTILHQNTCHVTKAMRVKKPYIHIIAVTATLRHGITVSFYTMHAPSPDILNENLLIVFFDECRLCMAFYTHKIY